MRADVDPIRVRAWDMRQWGYGLSERATRRFLIGHGGDTLELSQDGSTALLTLYLGYGEEFPRVWRIPMGYYWNDQPTAMALLESVLKDVERFGIPEDAERVYE